jgi:hypothetical protein
MTEVVLVSVNRQGYNGDRAQAMGSRPVPYKDYEIHARQPGQDMDKDTLVEEFSGYDNFNSSVKDPKWVSDQAFQKARKLAKLITGSEQNLIQEYGMTIEEARQSAKSKLGRRELQALGLI